MKEPGFDGRHMDKSSPKKGEIRQKRGDTLNRNLAWCGFGNGWTVHCLNQSFSVQSEYWPGQAGRCMI